MVFETRKWNNVAASRDAAIDRNKKKHSYRKAPFMFMCIRCETQLLDCLEASNWRVKYLNEE